MLLIRKYLLMAAFALSVILLFAYFSDERNIEYQYSGIVHDVKASSNGYIFYIDTVEESIRCYCEECPENQGYYAVRGSFSDDRGIFFVKDCLDIDIYKDQD